MLNTVKLALRITTDAFDEELNLLIAACKENMQGLGIIVEETGGAYKPQITLAVILFCKWKFGNNPDGDRWRDNYYATVAELKTMSGFTNWNETA